MLLTKYIIEIIWEMPKPCNNGKIIITIDFQHRVFISTFTRNPRHCLGRIDFKKKHPPSWWFEAFVFNFTPRRDDPIWEIFFNWVGQPPTSNFKETHRPVEEKHGMPVMVHPDNLTVGWKGSVLIIYLSNPWLDKNLYDQTPWTLKDLFVRIEIYHIFPWSVWI